MDLMERRNRNEYEWCARNDVSSNRQKMLFVINSICAPIVARAIEKRWNGTNLTEINQYTRTRPRGESSSYWNEHHVSAIIQHNLAAAHTHTLSTLSPHHIVNESWTRNTGMVVCTHMACPVPNRNDINTSRNDKNDKIRTNRYTLARIGRPKRAEYK